MARVRSRRRRRSHRRRNPFGFHSRRRVIRSHRRHYGRRHARRHNPPRTASISIWHPTSLFAPVASVAFGASVSASLPKMIWGDNVSTTTAYLTQIGVGALGSAAFTWILKKPSLGAFFLAGAIAPIFAEPIRRALGSVYAAIRPGTAAYPTLGDPRYYASGNPNLYYNALNAYPGRGLGYGTSAVFSASGGARGRLGPSV